MLLPVALNQGEYYQLLTYLRTQEYTYSTPETPETPPIAVATQGSPPIAVATPMLLRTLTEV